MNWVGGSFEGERNLNYWSCKVIPIFPFFFPDLVVYVRELSRMDEVVHSGCMSRQKLRGRWKAVGAEWFVQDT